MKTEIVTFATANLVEHLLESQHTALQDAASKLKDIKLDFGLEEFSRALTRYDDLAASLKRQLKLAETLLPVLMQLEAMAQPTDVGDSL